MSKLQGILGYRVRGAGFALVAAGLFAVSGCGGSATPDNTAADSGTPTDSGADGTPGDTKIGDAKPVEGGGDAKPTETGSTTPDIASTLLSAGNYKSPDFFGITQDDLYLVTDVDTNELKALPLAGGAPIVIDKPSDLFVSTNKVVFNWKSTNTKTNIGTLTIWTKAGGLKEVSKSSIQGLAAASDDGSVVVYTDNANSGGKVVDIVIDNATGTAKHTALTAQMNDTAKACSPLLFFSGTKALVSTCPAPSSVLPDAGTDVGHDVGLDVGGADAGPAGPAASVVLIDPSGSYTTLRSNVDNAITPSKAGDKFFVVDLSGNASVQPVDGSAAIAIDTGVSFGGINPEGTTAIYAPTAGGLKAASVSATPAPITLSSTKVAVFYTPIMGEKYMYFGNNYVPNAGTSDLQLIPLTGGTAVTLDSATDGALFGDRFTADGKYAVFYTSVATGTGNLTVKDVSVATDKGKQLTSAVWTGYSPKGSMLTYNDNWQTGGTGVNGTADIRLIDVSSPATNKLVAAQADDNFYLSNDKTKIVFVTSDPSFIKSGAYVANVP